MKLSVDQWIGLIQFGISTAQQIHGAIKAGKASVQMPDGTVVTGADAAAALDAGIAAALAAGDASADRIVNRT